MALVATVGASTSNSYVTQAEATTYFVLHPKSDTWKALGSDEKDTFLIAATRQIEMQTLRGDKNDTAMSSGVPDQSLHFPRSTDTDDGSEFIPDAIKRACYEQAVHLASTGGGVDTRSQLQAQGVASVSIGDVSETYVGTAGNNPISALAVLPRQLLLGGGFIRITGSFTRGN